MTQPQSMQHLPRVGDRIERYEVVSELAHGGMAALYVVRRPTPNGFDRLLAMKVIHPHLATERRFVEMFLDEARIAGQLYHPNIVQLFDVGEDQLPYIVMELVRGHSLAALMKKAEARGGLPVPIALSILISAANGLNAAHEAVGHDGAPLNVVHRDVSPKNLHIGYDGQVKVVDFGIAAARGRLAVTNTGELKGTPAYMSPEQVELKPVDRRADVWALGVVAWELFAHRRLFDAPADINVLWQVLNLTLPRLSGVPPSIERPIRQCLERDPAARMPSLAQLARELSAAGPVATPDELSALMRELFSDERAREEQLLTPLAYGKTLNLRPAPVRQPRRRVAVAAALLAVGAGAAAVLAWPRSPAPPAPAPAVVASPEPPPPPVVAPVAEPVPPEQPAAEAKVETAPVAKAAKGGRRGARQKPAHSAAPEPAPPAAQPEPAPSGTLLSSPYR